MKWIGCQHYRILSYRFSLRWNTPELQHFAESLYPCCRSEEVDSPEVDYFLCKEGESVRLYRGEGLVASAEEAFLLFPYLEWAVTEDALNYLSAFYQVHSGAVARNGRGILLPGESGSGKTTLVAALCLNGFSPLADDITMIDPDSCELVAFPRSFLIKEGSLQVLPELKFLTRSADNLYWRGEEKVWYLPREKLAAGRLPHRVRADYLVFPQRTSNARGELSELSQTEALEELITKSLNFNLFKPKGVKLLARFVRQVKSFRLEYGDVDGAVEATSSLVKD